jgi:hypothetical protein
MKNRSTYAAIATAALTCATATAQTTQPEQTTQSSITLVGCLQTEADYRRAQDKGRGGVAMTGAGLGNEYVLIQTEGAGGPGGYDATGNADCKSASAFAGTAYEITGDREPELKQFVGRRVEITGELKNADDFSRAGGFDPKIVSQDLRINEVNVASFREHTMTAHAATATETPATETPAAAAEPAPSQAATAEAPATAPVQRETVGTSGQVEQSQRPQTASAQMELPGTASPLGLAGLLGLFSLGGAVALRTFRR